MSDILNKEVIYSYSVLFFLDFIIFEMVYSHPLRRHIYTIGDKLNNLLFSVITMSIDLLIKGLILWYWIGCFVLQDPCYYIAHYVYHWSRFFWAMHVMHHNSEKFNITTGFRVNIFEPLTRYIFSFLFAGLGFDPLHIIFICVLGQIYSILMHTQSIRKLGPFGMDFNKSFISFCTSCF